VKRGKEVHLLLPCQPAKLCTKLRYNSLLSPIYIKNPNCCTLFTIHHVEESRKIIFHSTFYCGQSFPDDSMSFATLSQAIELSLPVPPPAGVFAVKSKCTRFPSAHLFNHSLL
jgi:hypothetical protein